MHFRKAALADKGKALGKFFLRLPGEGHDHVRGNGTAREPRPQQADAFIVPRGIILPPHSLQYRVAPGLHGQVELGTEVRKPGKPPAEILRHDSRFQTAQPHPQRRNGGADRLDQLRDRGLPGKVGAPAGDLNARHHDLPVAPPGKLLRLADGHVHRCGTNGAPGVGNDAVGAEIHAPVLHFQHGAGTFLQSTGREDFKLPAAQSVVQLFRPGFALHGRQHQLHKFPPPAAAADDVHSQRTHRLRGVLGVAAAYADDGVGIIPAAPADDRPVFLVCHGGDGAGVDNIAVAGLVKLPDLVPKLRQQLLHGLRLVLIRLAAKGIECKSHMSNPPIKMSRICINRPNRQLKFRGKLL